MLQQQGGMQQVQCGVSPVMSLHFPHTVVTSATAQQHPTCTGITKAQSAAPSKGVVSTAHTTATGQTHTVVQRLGQGLAPTTLTQGLAPGLTQGLNAVPLGQNIGVALNPNLESAKPVATVTPLSLPTSVLVPPTIAAVNPALFAATLQQQQQQHVQQQLQAAVSTVRPTSSSLGVSMEAFAAAVAAGSVDKKVLAPSVLRKACVDSRWSGADDKLLFLAGPKLK